MGWLLVGIAGAVIGIVIAMVLMIKWDVSEVCIPYCIGIPILVALLISLNGNNNNYNEKTAVLTEPLIALSDGVASSGSGGLFFVSVSANNMFTYYTEIESEYASDNSSTYASKTVPGSMVVIVEEKNNTEPRLVVYEQTGKKSFWYFNTPSTITEYVFYVPEGSIQRNMTLN